MNTPTTEAEIVSLLVEATTQIVRLNDGTGDLRIIVFNPCFSVHELVVVNGSWRAREIVFQKATEKDPV